ncbi:expressed unknown protein [Seminavis robusta]|uniref:Uncharacterized protein n=1 Tax=Seminavis robusta TaxID=568900 RepID=A0A9N8HDT3_9STRA|nr:expressed unknown protein [Seminavis robusta]|eukprot:Sro356_g125420.1 n/a (110) ;mRNA; f:54828-55157
MGSLSSKTIVEYRTDPATAKALEQSNAALAQSQALQARSSQALREQKKMVAELKAASERQEADFKRQIRKAVEIIKTCQGQGQKVAVLLGGQRFWKDNSLQVLVQHDRN